MMLAAASPQSLTPAGQVLGTAAIFAMTAAAVFVGFRPFVAMVRRRQLRYASVLRTNLLLNVNPRTTTILSAVVVVAFGAIGYALTSSAAGAMIAAGGGMFLPGVVLHWLQRRRRKRLEDQLVNGIQTLVASVQAGLNLVQAMQLIRSDGPAPLKQEFAHLLREYEYGVPLEDAMNNAATRIGSSDFGLLFSALRTHRERGGDLAETLGRIAQTIREVQRLQNRVKTLTAQGRAAARWLSVMPVVVLAIFYFLIPSSGIKMLFTEDAGKLLLAVILLLNIVGYLGIKKVVSIDI